MLMKRRLDFVAIALLLLLLLPATALASVVRMQTSLGVVDLKLYDLQVRNTVSNFLNYVTRGAYDNSFIHRSDPRNASNPTGVGVIQGGGYSWTYANADPHFAIPTNPPIDNEYSVLRPNVRGTIAMAKLGGAPDSATSQWFVNLVDNTTVLGVTNNGGFTVFGEVMANGMAVVDAIARLQRINASNLNSALATLPVISLPADRILRPANTVLILSAKVLPTTTAATPEDRVFNYLEAQFYEYIAPASQPSGWALGYYFRYYPDTASCIGVKDGMVYYLGPASAGDILELGTTADWLATAIAAGY